VGGAAATGVAAAIGSNLGITTGAQEATPISVDPGTPPAGIFESLQQYPLTTEPKTFRIMITDEQGERGPENATTQWLEELTGVHIEWIVVPAEGAIEQMTLQLASGDMPDAYMGLLWTPITPAQLAVYGDQGLFLDLKDLLAENAPNFNAQAETLPQAQTMITAPSGAIYSMPQINDCYHCSMRQKMWVNQAWLDKVGLAVPTTPEEFQTMLQTFIESDPNGNGQADEIAMTVTATDSLGDLDAFLMNPFQFSPPDPWLYVSEEGQVVSAYTQDGWREGVKYMRGLYAAGLLDPASFTQTYEEMEAKTKNPDTAVVGAAPTFWKATHFDFNAPYFKEYVAIPQLTGPTGLQQTYRSYTPGGVGGLMITSACEDPALLVKWADTLYTTEGTLRVARGKPGQNWRWAEPGEIGIHGEAAVWAIVSQAPGAMDGVPEASWFELCPMWFSSELRLSQAVVKPRDDETETILFDATKEMQEPWGSPESMFLPPLFFTAEQANIVALNGSGVSDLVRAQYTNWVTGQGDPDAEWEGYLEQLRSVGYDELLATYQQAYDERAT
jgi:putative aldouronate transport system substrate-binding protein